MAAEWMQFSWRWNGGTISLNLGFICEMSEKLQLESRTPREGQGILIRTVLIAILIGIAFYFSAKIGLALSFKPDYVAVFWPPNTIILTALVLAPPRRWWIFFLVMLPAYFTAAFEAGYSEQRAVIFFIANCLEVLIAATALRRILHKPPRFEQIKEVSVFVVFVVLVAPLVSASVASIATLSEPVPYWTAWRVWFLGDSLAHLALTPVLVTWIMSRKDWFRDVSIPRYAEAGGLTVGLIAVGLYAFGGEVGSYGNLPALVYTPLPLLLWAAIRFGPRGSCSATFIVTVLAIWNAVNGRGPFTTLDPAENVLSLQLFLMVISIPMMFLAAFIQEHKQAASALRESEERFRDMAESASDWFWEMGPDLRFTYHSERYFEITGFLPEEKIGTTRTRFVNPTGREADSEKWAAHLADLDTHKPFKNFEYSFASNLGRVCYVRISGTPIFGSDGEFLGYRGTGTDITERKGAEKALRESRDQMRLITDNLPVAIAYYDAEQRYRFVNRKLEVWFGRPAEEINGRTIGDILGKEIQDRISPGVDAALKGKVQNYEHVLTYPDGKSRAVHIEYVPHIDDSGTVQGCFALIQDITERKQAEEALRRSENRFRELLESAPDAMVIVNQKGVIILVNKQTETMFEYAREELVGSPVETLISHHLRAGHAKLRTAFIARPQLRSMGQLAELFGVARDGRKFPVEISLSPVQTEEGLIVLAAVRDITEHKQAEEQLRQAQKMEAVGQLTAGVAHDFNNMLGVILGNTELLEDELGKDNPRLATMFRATKRGADLTQRLLAFSRKQVLNPEIINANNLITDTTGLLRRTLEEHIEIETVTAAGLWTCEVDPAQLENALVNLALNARDAMPEGGKLTIETANARLDDDYAAAQAEVTPGRAAPSRHACAR